jgi:hypothetical protein
MATLLNDPGCATYGGNTGTPGCAFYPDQIVGAILIPEEKEFSNSDLDTFIATCQTLMLSAPATRIYPIFRFDAITDNTEDISIKTLGYGGKQVTKEGKRDYTFEMYQGGFCHNAQLRKFNNDKSKKVLLIDAKNIVYGVRTAADGLKGFSLDFFHAYDWKVNTGEEASKFMVRFAFAKVREFNEDLGYFDAGQDVEDALKGILDVELVDLGSRTTTKEHTIGIRTVCDKVNLYDAYSTLIDTNFATVFTATKAGVTANPTDCAPNALLKGWTLTFAATGTHVITMGTPAALAALLIGAAPDNGYEAQETLSITVD